MKSVSTKVSRERSDVCLAQSSVGDEIELSMTKPIAIPADVEVMKQYKPAKVSEDQEHALPSDDKGVLLVDGGGDDEEQEFPSRFYNRGLASRWYNTLIHFDGVKIAQGYNIVSTSTVDQYDIF